MTLLQQIKEINARFPVPESEKFAVVAEADRLLAAYWQLAAPDDELTYAVMRLLRYLRRFAVALELLRTRRPALPAKARDIDFYELELTHATDPEAARGLLEAFERGDKMRPSWTRAIARMRRGYESAGAVDQIAELESALARRQARLEPERHASLVRTMLGKGDEAMQSVLFMQQRLQALEAMGSGPLELQRLERHRVARLVFTCGFSYSGSGAVSCFLSQHREVSMPFGMSELGYLQGRNGRLGIFQLLATEASTLEGMKTRLATFFVESIVCLRAIDHHYSISTRCLRAGPGPLAALGALVDDFHSAMLSTQVLADEALRKMVVSQFLQRLFSLLGGSTVLLNNVFMAARMALLPLMENAYSIVVERDARDQYIARKTESRVAGHEDAEKFGKQLLQRRQKFRQIEVATPPGQMRERVRFIRFEDFVRDPALRCGLLDWLGLARDGLAPDPEVFDPAVSVKNIGIHAGKITASELAYLEGAVGVYTP